jgi:ESF2/ABP1 family protein
MARRRMDDEISSQVQVEHVDRANRWDNKHSDWHTVTKRIIGIAHEAAVHAAKLRVELAQSKSEQREYLRNVELKRILDKRNEKRKERGQGPIELDRPADNEGRKRPKIADNTAEPGELEGVLGSVF